MDWKDPKEKFPAIENKQGIRCLAYCQIQGNDQTKWSGWYGLVDVFFHPCIGWRRCDNKELIYVIKWVYIHEVPNFFTLENLNEE